MKTLLLDVDGVLVESNHDNLARVNAHFGTSYKFNQITDFNYTFMEDEHRDWLYDTCWHDPHLYDKAKLSQEWLDCLASLRDLVRVVACSSPLEGHIASKYRFLKCYFDRKDIVLASDKSIIQADFLVDDGLHNLKAFQGISICFARPWNEGWSGLWVTSPHDLLGAIQFLTHNGITQVSHD